MTLFQKDKDAAAAVERLLSRPLPPAGDELFDDDECFVPWQLFPALYGTYSSAFDELALDVLKDLRDGTFNRDDLAAEMFREMLCTTGLCEYGTSPRTCFPTSELRPLLPRLIEKWAEYARITWNDS